MPTKPSRSKSRSEPAREAPSPARGSSPARAPQITPTIQQAAGNQAVQALLTGGRGGPRISIGAPDDPLERDADRLARRATLASSSVPPIPPTGNPRGGGDPATHPALGAGRALQPGGERALAARVGADPTSIRLHTGASADRATRSVGASAFALNASIAFRAGALDTSTLSGRQLLAHELAHVAQGAHGAAPLLRRQLTREPLSYTVGTLATGAEVDHTPQHRQQRNIATWTGVTDTPLDTTFMVGTVNVASYVFGSIIATWVVPRAWTPGHYATEEAALAAIRASGTPGAVFLENGRYVAYHVMYQTWMSRFTWPNVRWSSRRPWTAVRFNSPDLLALVTDDGVILRREMYRDSDDAEVEAGDEAFMPGAETALPGYGAVVGDLNTAGEAQFFRIFNAALRDTALAALTVGRVSVEREFWRRGASGIVSRAEVELMQKTAAELARIDTALDALDLDPPRTRGDFGEYDPSSAYFVDLYLENLEKEKSLKAERVRVLKAYPMLARVNPREFIKLSEEQQHKEIGTEALGVLADIDETRDNILNGSLNLWLIPNVVNATIVALGITDPDRRKLVLERAAEIQRDETISNLIVALFTIAFSIGAFFATGPVALALTAGAFGLGVADAVMMTEDYLTKSSAANTALDPNASLVDPNSVPGWGWLVVAWAGVAFDAFDVIRAGSQLTRVTGDLVVDAVRRAADEGLTDDAIRELAGKLAAKTGANADELAESLRIAAGKVRPAEAISEATRVAVARRIGATIEITTDPAVGHTGVRVYYSVDSRGRVIVEGVRCGPGATILDILAHGEVVRLLRRYDGLRGRVRQLLDRLWSLVTGNVPPGVNPFPAGSAAFESWHELQKLPQLLDARMNALGRAIGTEHESMLRAEIDFLENQITHHQKVVDDIVLTRGMGYIALPDEAADLISKGVLPPLPDPAKYYYRRRRVPPPDFDIVRYPEVTGAEPLTLVPDPTTPGKWVTSAGKLSRTEEAARLVGSWPEEVQAAFRQVEADFPDAFKVVPLGGVATEPRTIIQLMDREAQDRLFGLVSEAFKRSGHADPAAATLEVVQDVLTKQIVVVRGTDQLRAYNYRLMFERTTGEAASADLHHVFPLYLGGSHRTLLDMPEDLHRQLHELIEQISLKSNVTLAPHSIQASGILDFERGAAVLMPDGTVNIAQLLPDGSYYLVR